VLWFRRVYMPKAILDKLPGAAKKIYEDAWDEAIGKGWDEGRAAAYAIGAVKQAGFRKNESTGSWVKMQEPMFVVFGEGVNDGEWIEVACTGDVVDMNGHRLSITSADFDRWIQAFEGGERGQDLPITLDHPRQGGEAAGWFRGLRKGPKRDILGSLRDTLLMKPEWTSLGQDKVAGGLYKYFSLEIAPGNMLRGGSLVNFPAVKGLKPVSEGAKLGEFYLREFYMAETAKKCAECGAPIPEGSDACPACGAIVEEEKEPIKEKKEQAKMSEVIANTHSSERVVEEESDFEVRLAAMEASMTKQLAEAQQTISGLAEENRKLNEQVARLDEINNLLRLNEKVQDVAKLEEYPGREISPAYAEKIVEILLSAPDSEDAILDLIVALASGEAVVEFGERGTGDSPEPLSRGSDSGARLHEKALAYAKENNVPYRTALIEVSKEA